MARRVRLMHWALRLARVDRSGAVITLAGREAAAASIIQKITYVSPSKRK